MQMILFEDDWKYYPTATADFETTNRSFVDTARLFKKMGVSNHTFLLALVNPLLKGVDPHDPNLSLELQGMIAEECKINPWYFFREIARAPSQSGQRAVPFQANRANISLFWCFFNHIFYILIQPRQTGKSFSVDTLVTLLMRVICTDTQINLLTKDDMLRRANIERLKNILDEIPPYLQMRHRSDANNGEEITVTRLGNMLKTHVPQASQKRALLMGRGLTSPIFLIDEGPFQVNIETSLPAALAAGGAANEAARASGSPYGVIMTTTAGKKDDRDGRYIYNLISEASIWNEAYYDSKNNTELRKRITANCHPLRDTDVVCRVNGTFNHLQLGKTDEWLRRKLMDAIQKGDDANRDYFNIWTDGSASSPFGKEDAARLASARREVKFTEVAQGTGFILRWYIDENDVDQRMNSTKVIIGMDTSNASGGDAIGVVFTDAYTLEVLAAATINEANLTVFSRWVVDLMVRFPSTILIPENRSSAPGIVDYIVIQLTSEGIDPFRRIFNRIVNEQMDNPERMKEIRHSGRRYELATRYKSQFGYPTSGSGTYSRDELYGRSMRLGVRYAADKLNDVLLVNQMLDLQIINGRVDHPKGGHDDMVISWLLTVWFLYVSTGLDWYGIDGRGIVTDAKIKMATMTPDQIVESEREQAYRERIEELCEKIADSKDPFLAHKYEAEVRILMTKVAYGQGSEIHTVDELLNAAKERRKKRPITNRLNVNNMQYGGTRPAQRTPQYRSSPYLYR